MGSKVKRIFGNTNYVCYFLCLETKKVTKESSRLQIILGRLFFSLPTQCNSSSFVLLKQHCLLNAFAASFKTVAFSQNSLRPFKIQFLIQGLIHKEKTDTNRRQARNAVQIFFGSRLTFLRLRSGG